MRERWIVISNCQSFGLANSIECLARDVDCTACDVWEFQRLSAERPDHFLDYDFALVMPEDPGWSIGADVRLPPHLKVPAIEFRAYQPDSIYVFADGAVLKGNMDAYHSMIALAAYKEGLSAEQASAFFNAEIYALAGYFDLWSPYRDGLVRHFASFGLDIAPVFVRRGESAAFMHTVNHPAIGLLFDLARIILTKLGQPIFADVAPPPDNLAGIAWPVYPEIGERLGVSGSYLFKPPHRHKPLELVPFLAQQLETFSAWDRALLRVIPALQKSLQRVRQAMRET